MLKIKANAVEFFFGAEIAESYSERHSTKTFIEQ